MSSQDKGEAEYRYEIRQIMADDRRNNVALWITADKIEKIIREQVAQEAQK